MAPKKAAPKASKSPKVEKKISKKDQKAAEKAEKAAKKAAKDAKPKRAPGPYMLFCKEQRPKIVAANPNFTFGEVGKALGSAWKALSDGDKAKFKA